MSQVSPHFQALLTARADQTKPGAGTKRPASGQPLLLQAERLKQALLKKAAARNAMESLAGSSPAARLSPRPPQPHYAESNAESTEMLIKATTRQLVELRFHFCLIYCVGRLGLST